MSGFLPRSFRLLLIQAGATLLVATLAGCAGPGPVVPPAADQTGIAPPPASESPQPANLGQLKLELDRYHDLGTYLSDITAVDAAAQAWVLAHAAGVRRPALVLDIDETALSNWTEMRANDQGYIPGGDCAALPKGPCGFAAWVKRAEAPAIAPTLILAQAAQAAHVALFFITGRTQDGTKATETNLHRAGYRDWQSLVMEPVGSKFASAADFKASARAAIEAQGYTILATVGDQMSDLSGGHAQRGFKLPNPFYFLP